MLVGVPKEIKILEYRVGLVPGSVRELVAHGHEVVVEHNAGQGIGMDDDAYRKAGAKVLATAAEVFAAADMIVKVKEPQAVERKMLRKGQVLFTYLHLAPDPEQTTRPRRERRRLHRLRDRHVVRRRIAAAGADVGGRRPDGRPGRRVLPGEAARRTGRAAGRRARRGSGEGRDPRRRRGRLARRHIALGMGAEVWVLDRSVEVLRALWRQFGRPLNTVFSTHDALENHVTSADLVIGGVLIPGASAPKLVSAALVKRMKPGSVIVDVAIDQGGCFETSHATTHADPTYVVDGVIHYCVANMPGGVPRTSTFALNNATLPFVLALADKGWKEALADDAHLKNGLNVAFGKVTCQPVAEALGYATSAVGSPVLTRDGLRDGAVHAPREPRRVSHATRPGATGRAAGTRAAAAGRRPAAP